MIILLHEYTCKVRNTIGIMFLVLVQASTSTIPLWKETVTCDFWRNSLVKDFPNSKKLEDR